MSVGKKMEHTNRSFANLVLNHMDNHNNSDLEENNVNLELSTGNDTPLIVNNKHNNIKDQT